MAKTEITLTIDELDDERHFAIKAKIANQMKSRLEIGDYQSYNVSTEIIDYIVKEVLEENKNLKIDYYTISLDGNYYIETGLKWAKKLKVYYLEIVDIKNIYRGSKTPAKIFRVIDNQKKEIKKIYKVINNQLVTVWDVS